MSFTERDFTRKNFRMKICDSPILNIKQTQFKQTNRFKSISQVILLLTRQCGFNFTLLIWYQLKN